VTCTDGAGLLDQFFNAVYGYRAQYYLSAEQGNLANRFAIDLLEPVLFSAQSGSRNLPTRMVAHSLSLPSAKIWIPNDLLMNPDLPRDIDAPLWQGGDYASIALQAPIPYRLEVFGAWLDRFGQEYVVERKRFRSEALHESGLV